MNYNQIAEKIEQIACERLEHFKDVPAALLLGPEDWNVIQQHARHYSTSFGSGTGFQTFSFNTTGGPIKIIVRKHIPSGVLVPVELGESEDDAYKNYYISKLDRELNDIVYRIVEDLE